MQSLVQGTFLFLQLLSETFILVELLLKLGAFMLELTKIGLLLLDQLDLFNKRRDDTDLRPYSLPRHLFLNSLNQRLMLLLQQPDLPLNVH